MVHLLRSSYGSITETEILFMNWEEANAYAQLITDEKRETRRWELYAGVAAAVLGFGGDNSLFESMLNSTYSDEEKAAKIEAQEAEDMRLLEQDRERRKEEMKKAKALEARKERIAQRTRSYAQAKEETQGEPPQEPSALPQVETVTPESDAPAPVAPKRRIVSSV